MSDTPELVCLYLEMERAKSNYEARIKAATEFDLQEMTDLMNELGYFAEEFPKKSEYVVRMRFDKKKPERWVAFPKKAASDMGRGLAFVIDHLDARGLL